MAPPKREVPKEPNVLKSTGKLYTTNPNLSSPKNLDLQ